jgi:hypothetical protein
VTVNPPAYLVDGAWVLNIDTMMQAQVRRRLTSQWSSSASAASTATFSWHVEFDDNCTLRSYESLTYVGLAN